jgi:ribonuclease BN (tRNA processing enzyme)
MRLTVVGCSGSFPGPESAASCYLVQHDGYALVLDLGSGALGPLQRYVDLDEVDAVLVSHLHADHCADLCGYYVARKYRPARTSPPPLAVYGPAGTRRLIAGAYGGISEQHLAEVFTFHDVTDGVRVMGPFTVTAARTAHPVECYAVRVEAAGRALVYTGDTGPSAAVTELAAAADLLLAEASFVQAGPNPADLHLTGRQAGSMAQTAGAARLVVTHVPPWHDPQVARAEAQAAFDGPVELARTGATYDL